MYMFGAMYAPTDYLTFMAMSIIVKRDDFSKNGYGWWI